MYSHVGLAASLVQCGSYRDELVEGVKHCGALVVIWMLIPEISQIKS